MLTVYFAHGKYSHPWGSKIHALADIARSKGFEVISPDYSDLADPDERVKRLLEMWGGSQDRTVLVGSSMGGYVSAVASSVIKPVGLFLMAPAFYVPGYSVQEPVPVAQKTVVVHGWNDDVIPVQHSIRYAQQFRTELHLLESDHRLNDQIPMLCGLFAMLLDAIGRH